MHAHVNTHVYTCKHTRAHTHTHTHTHKHTHTQSLINAHTHRLFLLLLAAALIYLYFVEFVSCLFALCWWALRSDSVLQAGTSSTHDLPNNHSVVPKRLHQTWKDNDIPVQWRQAQMSCQRLHVGYEYRLWTDEAAENVRQCWQPRIHYHMLAHTCMHTSTHTHRLLCRTLISSCSALKQAF